MVPGEPALEILLVFLAWLLPVFAVTWIFLRHVPFALVLALAPAPGAAAATLLSVHNPSGYAFGFCVGLLMGAALLRRVLGLEADWRHVAWAGAGAAVAMVPLDWRSALDFALCGISAGGLAAAAGRWLPFDEAFIARANRVGEIRARWLEAAGHIMVPRWALAISGIAMVMAALGWLEIATPNDPIYPVPVVLAATVFLVARDWRPALAAGLCAGLLWLFEADRMPSFFALGALLLSAASRGRQEDGAQAWRRALEEEGAGLLFAAAGGIVLLAVLFGGVAWQAGALAFLAALFFFPTITAALWSLFPRYRSVEEMYRS